MCNSEVGVAKRIDLEKISREIADLYSELDEEVKLDVYAVRQVQRHLDEIIKEKTVQKT
jgi:hypothetical protein